MTRYTHKELSRAQRECRRDPIYRVPRGGLGVAPLATVGRAQRERRRDPIYRVPRGGVGVTLPYPTTVGRAEAGPYDMVSSQKSGVGRLGSLAPRVRNTCPLPSQA